jgi:ATP-dependent protease ClpP protease subunit
MSCLQSAAVEVYLGAKRRIVGANANFMIHGAYIQGSVILQQTEGALRKYTEHVAIQNKILKRFFGNHTKIPRTDLSKISDSEF